MPALWQAGPLDSTSGWASSELFDYLKMIAVLGLILVIVIVGLRVWLPRIMGVRASFGGPIRVAARLSLEPRKSLYIVQAGGDYFLVGTSETGMHFLTRLDSERAEATMPQGDPVAEPEFASLIKVFKRPKSSP